MPEPFATSRRWDCGLRRGGPVPRQTTLAGDGWSGVVRRDAFLHRGLTPCRPPDTLGCCRRTAATAWRTVMIASAAETPLLSLWISTREYRVHWTVIDSSMDGDADFLGLGNHHCLDLSYPPTRNLTCGADWCHQVGASPMGFRRGACVRRSSPSKHL